MSDDFKRRIRKAVENFHEKQLPQKKPAKRKKKNKQPEKEVVKACLKWAVKMGWELQVYEAKATYNRHSGRYTSQTMNPGTPDIQGVNNEGIFIAIECKAPGRLSTFNREKNYRQQEYIKRTIRMNGFACVVDSAELLDKIFKKWTIIKKTQNSQEAQEYLNSMLPISTKAPSPSPFA